MNYTQSIGNITELTCLAKFIELGYECSIPYGNGAKYDFIADIDGRMLRIQCKSASRVKARGSLNKEYDDAIAITTTASTTNTKKITKHTYTESEIDYFATCYNNQVYLIPVSECSTSKTLRFSPPQNGNFSYTKAENYEIEKIIPVSSRLVESKNEYENRMKSMTRPME